MCFNTIAFRLRYQSLNQGTWVDHVRAPQSFWINRKRAPISLYPSQHAWSGRSGLSDTLLPDIIRYERDESWWVYHHYRALYISLSNHECTQYTQMLDLDYVDNQYVKASCLCLSVWEFLKASCQLSFEVIQRPLAFHFDQCLCLGYFTQSS